ncbi:replication initiation and membrane attachment family protein [Limosilactobacillus pontis]|uniref:Replication initiation and membrane attachment family protein n=1 Tax=Limosilactobacillus pontis DSM 8475 TaxID=1423794 RepID=A0A922PV70_9LACO|nr:DnaD domain protein [Limosilactobacillus pontis]KRM37077.1 replication initiation and membrane attachment family protein [Limosilactobacillus pontis DSM 8475]QFV01255.1 hypothetical protein LP475_05815 [Limosilactobacillus pontis]
MKTAPSFDPQAGYLVTAAADFINFSDQTFTDFYQPVLGPAAFSLFYALRSQLVDAPTLADRRLQSNLLVQVNAGQRQVDEGLCRLEGMGIVSTYFQHDAQGDLYVYELQATLTPERFFADNLLSVLLLEAIGESAFQRLAKRAYRYRLAGDRSHLKDISHHFLDTYQVDQRELVSVPAAVKQAQTMTSPAPSRSLVTTSDDFDWPTLMALLKGQPVAQDDLADHRELIEVEHQLYGIDEPTMARLIRGALDLATNHFDAKKFKRQVAASYKRVAESSSQTAKQVPSDDKQLTTKDRQLLKSTDNYAPITFLQALKEQTGGYVTAGERNVLTRLIQDGKLPSPVINVLVWYVIADLGNATLKGNFVDAIANDWLRAGVHDGAGALIQLKKFNQDRQQAPTKRKPGQHGYRRMEVRETMPDWSKQDKAARTKKASAVALAKARARQANKRKEG